MMLHLKCMPDGESWVASTLPYLYHPPPDRHLAQRRLANASWLSTQERASRSATAPQLGASGEVSGSPVWRCSDGLAGFVEQVDEMFGEAEGELVAGRDAADAA